MRFAKLKICEEDLVEKFVLGTGRGGQKVNKTSSCVYLKHLPTGIEVKCQKERSRELNRLLARLELADRLEEIQKKEKQEKAAEKAKTQRLKRKRSPRQKEKLLESKRRHSQKKQQRSGKDYS
jgi:protein subunit release factor B